MQVARALRVVWVSVALILTCAGPAQSEGNLEAKEEAPPRRLERISNSSISPDGTYVLYRMAADRNGEPVLATYHLINVMTGATIQLPGAAYLVNAKDHVNPPIWAPDSSKIAYTAVEGDIWRLIIWDTKRGRLSLGDSGAVCGRAERAREGGCVVQSLEWTPDSRSVIFLAPPSGTPLSELSIRSAKGHRLPWERLLMSDPENDGATRISSRDTAGLKAVNTTSVVEARLISTEDGEISTIASRSLLQSIKVSPDGRSILIAYEGPRNDVIPQRHVYYEVLSIKQPDASKRQPLLMKAYPERTSWSPDSRKIAFVESGPTTDGDIILYELQSGTLTNLTGKIDLPGEAPEADRTVEGRDATYAGRKFGASDRIDWTANGAELLVSRQVLMNGSWRRQLWVVSARSGAARSLSGKFACDVAQNSLTLSLGTIVGMSCDASIAFADVDGRAEDASRKLSIPGRLTSRRLPTVSKTGRIAFVIESAENGEEINLFDPRSHALRRLTSVNTDLAAAGSSRIVRWSYNSQPRAGRIFLPATAGQNFAKPPLIIQLYPRDEHYIKVDDQQFVTADTELHIPLADLVRRGYSVFKPEFPTQGGGNSCSALADEVRAAIRQVEALGYADVRRVGVFGHSFGGWAATCIMTRLPDISAGVSVAGISDWISGAFSPITNSSPTGGQLRIGKTIWEDPEAFWRESPLSGVHNIQAPLLLLHGKRDDAVAMEQSLHMYFAMKSVGKDVTLIAYDDADHSSIFRNPHYSRHVIDWFERLVPIPRTVGTSASGAIR
ncbi:prolyl oligopeptidase family serine peptidase [Sphingomonas sp. BT-65]|uniref:S9 family peptidase n=1 Tax=Sphingomonas sp. BT-65 TaxID=2989821 RepID=UPI002235C687|nr:alpha/beta fold hydrolase [Sphingomonas sp. BT-65]MCW4460810.1 prolyl oligopeptidase family serine peptidase [Sphingomonas sp. BT-65]